MVRQKLAHQTPDPAETHDQHGAVWREHGGVRGQAFGRGCGGEGGGLGQRTRQHGQQGDGEHAEGGGQHGLAGQARVGQSFHQASGQDNESELARRTQNQGGFDG